VHNIIRITSCIIILLGIVHIGFAFPIQMNEYTLWFVGSGMAIIFSGLLNFVALNRGGSNFTKLIAVTVNILNCALFFLALSILNQPQVYVGILIFLITSIAFAIDLQKNKISKA
jgi:hypothetical protein